MENRELGLGRRWRAVRPTKTAVGWSWVGVAVVTMVIGFTWGGWVTGGTAGTMARAMADEAVVKRLAPMCVIRVKEDPAKTERLKELRGISSWQRAEYVKKQGWATMPGEQEPDGRVADECVKLLIPEG
jgi:hypothetical protein